tara:strand:+ start:1057 stop:2112 length:1056 start_codon:yes stop_codon:yes gene_type:complete
MAEEDKLDLGENLPGADPREEDPEQRLDLNFPEEIEESTEEVAEEVTEETVAEDNQDENETDGDITAEETTENVEESTEAEESAEAEPEEPELEEAAELEEEAETKPKKPMVPKSRLDEVLAKQRKLQEQLDALTVEKETVPSEPVPEAYDFDSKELEYQEHVLNGETDKAVALRKEIRAAEKTQLEFEMGQKFNQYTDQSQQLQALQKAAIEMETQYPVFDKNSDTFNEDYTNEVIQLRDAFVSQGNDVVEALQKAVTYVVKTNDIETISETSTLDAPAPKQTTKTTDQVAKKRKEVSKKLKAAETQPPDMPGESSSAHGEKVVDISSMTDDEFNALPEATLKRLRGDIG